MNSRFTTDFDQGGMLAELTAERHKMKECPGWRAASQHLDRVGNRRKWAEDAAALLRRPPRSAASLRVCLEPLEGGDALAALAVFLEAVCPMIGAGHGRRAGSETGT